MARLTTSYDAGTLEHQLVDDTIGAALASMVASQPDRLALVARHQDIRWTWDELGEEVERVALGLLALGIERGDRVGIWSPTCAEWTVLQFARARVGAILVNVNPAYRPIELAYALRPIRRATARHRRVVQDIRLPRHDRRSARRAPGARAGGHDRHDRRGW